MNVENVWYSRTFMFGNCLRRVIMFNIVQIKTEYHYIVSTTARNKRLERTCNKYFHYVTLIKRVKRHS